MGEWTDCEGVSGVVFYGPCKAQEVVTNTVSSAGNSFLEQLVKDITGGVADVMTSLLGAWMHTPTESLASDSPVGAAIVTTQGYLSMLTLFFGILGLMIAAGRMAWNARGEELKEVIRMLLTLVFVQGAAIAAIQLLLKAGDEFSIWLLDQATGADMHTNLTYLIPIVTVQGAAFGANTVNIAVGALLIIVILVLIATAMQFIFLVLRDVLLAIILAFLPTMAAASLFKGGSQAFEKAVGWIVALLLYKPVAAGIYVLGVLMVKGTIGEDGQVQASLGSLCLGIMTLLLATLALPALIKFVAPAAGRGVSSAFSGAAGAGIAAGAVATGAAIVALAPTGGASAGAAGASSGALTGSSGAASLGGTGATAATTGSGAAASPIPSGGVAGTTGTEGAAPSTKGTSGTDATGGAASSGERSGASSGTGAATTGSNSDTTGSGSSGAEGSGASPTGGGDTGSGAPTGAGSAPSDGSTHSSLNSADVARAAGAGAQQTSHESGAAIEELS